MSGPRGHTGRASHYSGHMLEKWRSRMGWIKSASVEPPSPTRRRGVAWAWWRGLALAVLASHLSFSFAQVPAPAADAPRVVFVAPISGTIDLGLAPFVQRVLDEASAAGAAAVILEINTFGGRVDAAVKIRDALLNSPVRTVAFINKRAISAGALISLAATDIVISSGGTIGAATPVLAGGAGKAALPVEEKTV